MGNTVGSMRRVIDVVPGGSDDMMWESAVSTCKVAAVMSRPQPKSTEILAPPRLDPDFTSSTPGMTRSASSTGRVTSWAIWSAGRSPESSDTCTRGKATCGNSPTGSEVAANAPATVKARATKTMDLA